MSKRDGFDVEDEIVDTISLEGWSISLKGMFTILILRK